ncbi:MAG: hypothetical protein IPG45_31295 [Deltaproteobacteria bacterium]|nr:hypothetical protein [Deltaproteobacteria bacterium]
MGHRGVVLLVCLASSVGAQQAAAEPSPVSALTTTPAGPLILGDQDQLDVTITAPETPATIDRPLRVSVNVGTFGPIARVSAGLYRTTYTLPTTRFPQVALVAVWRETGPDAQVDFHRIPLSARTELPIEAKAGATVTVGVGDQELGPFEAPKNGQLVVPLVIPPGVERILVQSVRGARRAQAWVPARVPPYNHLTLALTPHRIPADGVSHVILQAYYDGPPPPLERFRITGGEGKIDALGLDGSRAIFRYVPSRAPRGGEVRLEAHIAKEPSSTASALLTLGQPIPERATPRPLEGPWLADGQSQTTLLVLVTDRYGLGVSGLVASATAAPARVVNAKELGEGLYSFRLEAPPLSADRQVKVHLDFRRIDAKLAATVELPLALPPGPADLSLQFDPPEPLPTDEPFNLRITPVDANGVPIAAQKLELEAMGATVTSSRSEGVVRHFQVHAGLGPITLRMRTENFERSRELRLIPHSGNLFLAGFLAGSYGTQILPGGGLELGYRTPWLDARLSFFLRGAYRYRQAEFSTRSPSPIGTVAVETHTIPLWLGARYEFVSTGAWRVYGHGGAGVVFGQHRLDVTFAEMPQEPAQVAIFGPAAEVGLGASWSGIFCEAAGAYEGASVNTNPTLPRVTVPPLLLSLALGYRWEVK